MAMRNMDPLEMIGCRQGKLTVRTVRGCIDKRWWYLCDCDCGKTAVPMRRDAILRGAQSCGCGVKEAREKQKRSFYYRKPL